MSDEVYICRRILHDGDGPPGPERKVRKPSCYAAPSSFDSPSEAAEYFAEEGLYAEMCLEGLDESSLGDFHNTRAVVEVRLAESTEWTRYVVAYRVKLECTAELVTKTEVK